MSLKRTIRFSQHPLARSLKKVYYLPGRLSVPALRLVVRPLLIAFESTRTLVHFCRRVFIAEPLFKAYCRSYGDRLHTGIFVHWIQGRGDIVLGNDVRFDGKSSFKFAARYVKSPLLQIGDNTGVGHGCSFTVGKAITIGKGCRIASGVVMFDSPGHTLDPAARRHGEAASDEEVRPIHIEDNVWIGANSTIFPGVTIGENSVVAMGSSVMTDVPRDTVVGGNPARSMKSLKDRNA